MNIAELRAFAPGGDPALLAAIADNWHLAEAAGITTPLRVCHFLAQLAVESAFFRRTEENLSYSTKRLTQVWPKRFPTISAAIMVERNPEALANAVYGGRMGNTAPGDGWKFRGRGPKQITGRDNYRRIGRMIGVDLEREPDLLLDPIIGFRAALAYWKLARCDRFADANDIRGLTHAVNGGFNGLADRRAAFRQALAIWGDEDTEAAAIGGKGPARSNIGRASLIGGGLTAGGVATQAYEVAQLVENGRSISDAFGIPLITLVLFVAVLGLLVYIFRDRIFIAKHEGL